MYWRKVAGTSRVLAAIICVGAIQFAAAQESTVDYENGPMRIVIYIVSSDVLMSRLGLTEQQRAAMLAMHNEFQALGKDGLGLDPKSEEFGAINKRMIAFYNRSNREIVAMLNQDQRKLILQWECQDVSHSMIDRSPGHELVDPRIKSLLGWPDQRTREIRKKCRDIELKLRMQTLQLYEELFEEEKSVIALLSQKFEARERMQFNQMFGDWVDLNTTLARLSFADSDSGRMDAMDQDERGEHERNK